MTGPVAAADRLTVKARSFAPLLPSLTVASATERVGSGAVSSLVMVPIAVPSAMVAPLGEESVSVKRLVGLDGGVARHLHVDHFGRLAGGEGERAAGGGVVAARGRRAVAGGVGHGDGAGRGRRQADGEGEVARAAVAFADRGVGDGKGRRGAVSSLVIVPTAVPSAMVAPLGDDRVSVTVSLASTAVSPDTWTRTTLEVSPAAKVSVPLSAV